MIVSVGCFSGGLVGLSGQPEDLQLAYAYSPSKSCIRAMHCTGQLLIAGGVDETLRIFIPEKKIELGSVMVGLGSINCIDSHFNTVLVGTDSGAICVYRTKDWELLHTFEKHMGSVESIHIHPSGKLALSIGLDWQVYLWNLVTARPVYHTKV
jgi:protein MAK11